jgi:Ca2+-binding RTX toxin-like protein
MAIINGDAGDNNLIGGADDDTINGLAGNDFLDGGAGADTMVGGAGDDSYVVDNALDSVVEAAGEGNDRVFSSVNYTLSGNVEILTLQAGTGAVTGTGNALDNDIIGNQNNNTLTGLDGSDYLDGGTGTDTMTGGQGNDIYVVDNIGDIVNESSGEGTDLVISSVNYTLGANLERLTLP